MMKGKIFSFSSPLLFLSAAGEKKRGGEATENPSFFPSRPRAGEEEEIIQRRRRMGTPDRDRRGGGEPTSTLQNNRGRYTCYYFCRCRGKGRDFLACKMRWRRRGAKKTKNKETRRRRRPSIYMRMHVFCELQRSAPRDPPLPKWRNYWLRNISFPLVLSPLYFT